MNYTEAINQASKLSKENSEMKYHVKIRGDSGSAVIQASFDDTYEGTYHKGLIELRERVNGLTKDERFNALCDGKFLADYAVTSDQIDDLL